MYKIGDYVKSFIGIGCIEDEYKELNNHFIVNVKGNRYILSASELEKYKTAHEKLLEMGWKFSECTGCKLYQRKGGFVEFNIEQKTYTIYTLNNYDVNINLELSRILTQYLEELEEEK